MIRQIDKNKRYAKWPTRFTSEYAYRFSSKARISISSKSN